MEKKNDKKFNWKKAAVIGGIFAVGVAVGVAWLPETAKEIGETILQYAEEGMANG